MRIHIWCILAPVFLVSVKASLHDNVAQSFYETPQSSSPSPLPDYTQSPQPEELEGMREIVLFLTPDQVNALQAAGAVVRPYPEDEVDFAQLQQQLPQGINQESKQHYQMQWNPNQNLQLNAEVQNYYKLLNIQEINDNLSQTTEATEGSTGRTTTTPRYRITNARPRFKEKESSTTAVPKRKASRTSNSYQHRNIERTRFQYHYENENYKKTPPNSPTPYNTPALYSSPSPYNTPASHNTPTPYNNPVPYNTPAPYQSGKKQPNDYYQPSKEIQRNQYYQNQEAHQNAFSGTTGFGRQNIYTASSTKAPFNAYTEVTTESQQKTNTHLPPTYQSGKKIPNNQFQPSREIQRNQYYQPVTEAQQNRFSETTGFARQNVFIASSTKAPSIAYTKVTTESQQKPSTHLPPSYQSGKKQPNNYYQPLKDIQRNQYHQPVTETHQNVFSGFARQNVFIASSTKAPSNAYSEVTTESQQKPSTTLPLFPYQSSKKQPNDYYQPSKEIQRNQYHQPGTEAQQNGFSGTTGFDRQNVFIASSTKAPSTAYAEVTTESQQKPSTHLPSSYQSGKKQSNNYYQPLKDIQRNQYYQHVTEANQNAFSGKTGFSRQNVFTASSTKAPSTTYAEVTTESQQKLSTHLPPLYQSGKKHLNNNFQPSEDIQRNQYHQPVTEAHQNAFPGTTGFARQNVFTASSTQAQSNAYTEVTTESKPEPSTPVLQIGNRKVNKYSARNVYRPPVPAQVQEAQESVKPQTLVEVPSSYIAQTQAPILIPKPQDSTESRVPLTSEMNSPRQEEEETQVTPALPPLIRTPFGKQDKLSLLLAPLYKHRTIFDIVSQQKDDLIRSESNVNSKLQYLTQTHPYFNTKEEKTNIEQLPGNFSKHNALAKLEATSPPSDYVNNNSQETESSPPYLTNTSEFPIQKQTTTPQDFITSSPNSVPIELIRQFPPEEEIIHIGGVRNVYGRTEKPYSIQTIAPLRLKHTTPESLPLSDPDSPIFRPIWEH